MKNKKLLIGSLSLATITLGSLAFISKPTYKTIDNTNLNTERMAVYINDGEGNYEASTTIPTSGYTLNEGKSSCNNGATPTWNSSTKNLKIKNLSSNNTSCYLYFDKQEGITKDDIIAAAKAKESATEFTTIAETDEGIFKVNDGYGDSYYWRGAVTDNYVKFASKCWRIIRINGDGSIRLIYDGETCHANGTSTTENLINTGLAYNTNYNHNAYVGYMYGSTSTSADYAKTHTNTTDSNIKKTLDSWYDSNIGYNLAYTKNVDEEAGFCNDRSLMNNSGNGAGTNATYYAAKDRIGTSSAKPVLSCEQENDLFTTSNSSKGNHALTRPIGLITVDEIVFAGGLSGKGNTKFYLYNGQYFWTMTPSHKDGTMSYMFYMHFNGIPQNPGHVHWTDPGARPVINLKSTTTFSSGNGEKDTPYVVEGSEI